MQKTSKPYDLIPYYIYKGVVPSGAQHHASVYVLVTIRGLRALRSEYA